MTAALVATMIIRSWVVVLVREQGLPCSCIRDYLYGRETKMDKVIDGRADDPPGGEYRTLSS